jgi:CCR4-NOT transcription complex subunit 2
MLKREGLMDAVRAGRGVAPRGKDELGPAMEFGLLGLMDVLRMKSQDMNLVRVGYDLTSLGLNPNSQELLFPSFVSPWPTSRRPPPEFQIPECYQLKEPPNLKPSMFSKFSLETLIYIFHSVPGDVIQMAAAQELYLRKWRFHKGLKQWISRAPKGTSALDSQRSEVGTYSVFEVPKWEKIRREGFKLLYEDLVELRAETKA